MRPFPGVRAARTADTRPACAAIMVAVALVMSACSHGKDQTPTHHSLEASHTALGVSQAMVAHREAPEIRRVPYPVSGPGDEAQNWGDLFLPAGDHREGSVPLVVLVHGRRGGGRSRPRTLGPELRAVRLGGACGPQRRRAAGPLGGDQTRYVVLPVRQSAENQVGTHRRLGRPPRHANRCAIGRRGSGRRHGRNAFDFSEALPSNRPDPQYDPFRARRCDSRFARPNRSGGDVQKIHPPTRWQRPPRWHSRAEKGPNTARSCHLGRVSHTRASHTPTRRRRARS